MSGPIAVAPGRFTVPHNRWDLLPGPSQPPSVSVIVPFYEQQEQLDRLLVGLELQGPGAVVDVVIADDGSACPPVVPPRYRGPPVRVVRQPDAGFRAGAARNLGARASRGEVLVFLDADMIPSPGFVEAMARLPTVAPEAVVVGTRHHHDLRGWAPDRVRTWLLGGDPPPRLDDPAWLADGYRRSNDLIELDRRSYQLVISAVLAMSRTFFAELGGFDEDIVEYGGEDWDLAHRAQNAGAILAHVPAVAHHDGPDWRARSGASTTKNPELRNLAHRIPGRHDPIIGSPLVLTTLHAGARNPDAVVACVASILQAGGTAGAVVIEDPPAGLRRLVHHDSRVHLGQAPPDLVARSSVAIHVLAPVSFSASTFDALLDLVEPGGPGRVVVQDRHGPVLTCAARRVQRRIDRWSGDLDAASLATALFGAAASRSAAGLGIDRLGDDPDLAAVFVR